MEILVICAFAIGGLFMPLLCAAVAMNKHRSANRWFAIACVGLYIFPLLGALLALIVLACMPKGAQAVDTQKFLGLSVSAKSLFIASAVLAVIFGLGIAGLVPAIMTIVNAVKWN